MPRLPTILVIGSQDMSTILPASGWTLSLTAIVSPLFRSLRGRWQPQRGSYPVVSSGLLCRHFGSLFTVLLVMLRSLRIKGP